MTVSVPQAAIIVPHYNDTRRLRLCLDALAPQVAGHSVELVVADNGSTEDMAPLVADFPWARFVTEAEKGAAAARNRGVAETGAPRLFFIDADCIPDPDWVAVALAQPDGDAMIGGRVDLFDETPPPRSGAETFETVFGFNQRRYIAQQKYSVTANLLTTRAVFDAAGPFRNGVSEDWDWCNRAFRLGYPIRYEDRLRVRHPTRSDWPALHRKWRRTTSEMFHVNGTDPVARLRWALRAGIVLGSSVPHQVRILRHPGLSASERWRGGLTLVRLRAVRAGWMLRQAITGR